MTTMATESRSPTAGGFFAFSLVSDLISAKTRILSLVSCPQDRPVRAWYSNGSSVILFPVLSTSDLNGGTVVMSRLFRHSQETFTLACGNVDRFFSSWQTSFGTEIH